MKERQLSVIDYLLKNQTWISGKELAKRFDVTDRTIRSDIDRINSLGENLVVSNNRLGYKLDVDLYTEKVKYKLDKNSGSPEERAISILKKLLYQNYVITIYDLEQEYYVSDYTIEADLRKIKSLIEPYEGIYLEKSQNRVTIRGDEIAKRKLYKDLLMGEVHDNFVNIKHISKLYTRFNLEKILDKFNTVSKAEGYQLRTTAIPMVSMHLGITVDRMMHGNFLSNIILEEKLLNSTEFKVALQVCEYICMLYQIEFHISEVNSLTRLLFVYHDSSFINNELLLFNNIYNLNEVVDGVLKTINEEFNIDFTLDLDFINGIQMHLSSMVDRLQNNQKIVNVYLTEIKKDFPLIFEMAIKVSKLLRDLFKTDISEDEVGFIALHLGLAFDRLSRNYKYRVVVIAAPNDRQIYFMKNKLESKFSDRLTIVEIESVLDESKLKNIQPDLIISPLKLNHQLMIPTIQISMFMNQTDESQVFQILSKLDKRRLNLQFISDIGEMIDKDLFTVGASYKNRENAINEMGLKLLNQGLVDGNYLSSVFDREAMSCTAFDVGIAVPHPLQTRTNKSVISVSLLDRPLDWGGIKVRIILLLSIDSGESHKMWTFFEWLGQIISDKTKLSDLYQSRTRDEFIEKLLD